MTLTDRIRPLLLPATAVAMLAAVVSAFLVAPEPSAAFTAPQAFSLFYFHVPTAWAGYLAFFVTFAYSIAYLRTREADHDRWAAASAEVGTLMISVALFSGMAWARAEWGVFWRWDLKLIMVLVLWLSYLGYNALRAAVPDREARARTSAVFGIVAFAGVPLSYLAGQIWVTLHPNLAGARAAPLDPLLGQVLGLAMAAFTLLYVVLTLRRHDLAVLDDEVDRLRAGIEAKERAGRRPPAPRADSDAGGGA